MASKDKEILGNKSSVKLKSLLYSYPPSPLQLLPYNPNLQPASTIFTYSNLIPFAD